jgi:iron(II)-dependent oxidoreductase
VETRALVHMLTEARDRTLDLLLDLDEEQWTGPRLAIVNPPRWELGHVGWFHEYWGLRCLHGEEGLRADADDLWDSIAIPHDARWDLPLPDRAATLAYVQEVLERAVGHLEARAPTPGETFLVRYAVHHEHMHSEAFTYTRQTLSYPAPPMRVGRHDPGAGGDLPGDVEIPGGRYRLGAERGTGFVFDNERWAHEVDLPAFRIARAPVTNAAFAAFVEAGGYDERAHWDAEGWRWRLSVGARHPVYWRPAGRGFERRHFDRWVPLEPHHPVVHVCAHEAEAWCRWANRRLPTEAEWERAACGLEKRTWPWGEAPPTPERAALGWRHGGLVDVGSLPAGETPEGCRHLVGQVWEWTADAFRPYPAFRPDVYREYSRPQFGTTRVLRGGCWATQPSLLRGTWRNFYAPSRRDVWAGFRTCAPD